MRDPKRIERIILKLKRAWELDTDSRLGQFISNLMGPGRHDVFFPEDDKWEKWLDEFIEMNT